MFSIYLFSISKNKFVRLILFANQCLLIIGMVKTESRKGFIIIPFGIFIYFLLTNYKKIAKSKNKNLKSVDKKFINDNHSILFRTVSQDVLSTMNSEIDKNYTGDEEAQKIKQKIKDPGTFELNDKEKSGVEKGRGYQEYQDLINEAFSEVNNIDTEDKRDKKLEELDKKDVLDDFKNLFKYKANLAISKRDLKQKTAEISGRNQRLNSIIGTSDSDEEYEMKERGDISKLEEELKNKEREYENLRKKASSYKKEDLKLGTLKKSEGEDPAIEENIKNFTESGFEGFSSDSSGNKSGNQQSNSSSSGSESGSQGFGSNNAGENKQSDSSNKPENDFEEQVKGFNENFEKKKKQKKGKTYKETMKEKAEKKNEAKNKESAEENGRRGDGGF
jgi:hypothetical protein